MRSLPHSYLARAGEKYAKNLMGCIEGTQPFDKNPQPAACMAARAVACRRLWRMQAGEGPMRHRACKRDFTPLTGDNAEL